MPRKTNKTKPAPAVQCLYHRRKSGDEGVACEHAGRNILGVGCIFLNQCCEDQGALARRGPADEPNKTRRCAGLSVDVPAAGQPSMTGNGSAHVAGMPAHTWLSVDDLAQERQLFERRNPEGRADPGHGQAIAFRVARHVGVTVLRQPSRNGICGVCSSFKKPGVVSGQADGDLESGSWRHAAPAVVTLHQDFAGAGISDRRASFRGPCA